MVTSPQARAPKVYVTKIVRDLTIQYDSGLVTLTLMPEDTMFAVVPENEKIFTNDFIVVIAATQEHRMFYMEGRRWMSLTEREHRFESDLRTAIAEKG